MASAHWSFRRWPRALVVAAAFYALCDPPDGANTRLRSP
jgi:hypothetical protein